MVSKPVPFLVSKAFIESHVHHAIMAGFGGLRKGREEAKDNLSYTEGATALVAVVVPKILPWQATCNAAPAAMNGRIQIMSKHESVLNHQRTDGMLS